MTWITQENIVLILLLHIGGIVGACNQTDPSITAECLVVESCVASASGITVNVASNATIAILNSSFGYLKWASGLLENLTIVIRGCRLSGAPVFQHQFQSLINVTLAISDSYFEATLLVGSIVSLFAFSRVDSLNVSMLRSVINANASIISIFTVDTAPLRNISFLLQQCNVTLTNSSSPCAFCFTANGASSLQPASDWSVVLRQCVVSIEGHRMTDASLVAFVIPTAGNISRITLIIDGGSIYIGGATLLALPTTGTVAKFRSSYQRHLSTVSQVVACVTNVVLSINASESARVLELSAADMAESTILLSNSSFGLSVTGPSSSPDAKARIAHTMFATGTVLSSTITYSHVHQVVTMSIGESRAMVVSHRITTYGASFLQLSCMSNSNVSVVNSANDFQSSDDGVMNLNA